MDEKDRAIEQLETYAAFLEGVILGMCHKHDEMDAWDCVGLWRNACFNDDEKETD